MPKVTVTIQAPAEHPDVLDIRDAMQQVLDFFELLSGDDDRDTLAWNFTFAGTNSPFTAEAEATSNNKDVDVTYIANTRISETASYMSDLRSGRRPTKDIGKKRRSAAKRVFVRNTQAIGKTTVNFSVPTAPEVVLTPSIAQTSLALSQSNDAPEVQYLSEDRERHENGSIEGRIVDVSSDYNHPAIRIEERKSGREINCRVGQEVIDSIASATSLKDVWEHRRVRVRGVISFDSAGQITRVYAKSVTPIAPRAMTLKDIEDRDFTGGLQIEDYLDKLREGNLG
jgi:hypothetical protein